MRKRGNGFHGEGRMGTGNKIELGSVDHMGGHGSRVFKAAPQGFNAMAPAPKFPGTGGITMPTPAGSHAPTLPGVTKRR